MFNFIIHILNERWAKIYTKCHLPSIGFTQALKRFRNSAIAALTVSIGIDDAYAARTKDFLTPS